MKAALDFLRARFAERSSRVQLVVLGAMAAVGTGYLTLDQIEGFTAKAVAMTAVAGPLLGILLPETDKSGEKVAAAEAAADAAIAYAKVAATEAAMKVAGPEAAAEVEAEVGKLVGAASAIVGRLGL